jgi:nucleoid-associated protein YgaU
MPIGIYIVQCGDCLWTIAQRFLGDGNKWPMIYNMNKNVIGSNPNLIRPGQALMIIS